MRQLRICAFGLALSASYVLAVMADEQLVPIAASGDWVAMAHRASITAAPDVCMALNLQSGLGLRAEDDATQVRIMNPKWSLPASVQGSILITVGNWKLNLDISDNTNDMISAELQSDQLQTLLSAMDQASSMAVTVGKAKPFTVSLIGSSKVANAFRTCAGIKGGSNNGGENPFR